MNSTKMGYQIAFPNPAWIGADVELALRKGDIPPVPTLNIMSPNFCAAPFPSTLKNDLEPFAIVLMWPDLDEATVSVEQSWYNHSSMAAPLLAQQDPWLV